MSQYNQNKPQDEYTAPPLSHQPHVVVEPPPSGYPMKYDNNIQENIPPHEETKSKGGGFWRGCCAALCCCCALDACF